ncbi:MAG: sugar phosphate isomerase/epimerase [Clostridia bacterium]|nr:sugar phosphate isomerase/epimerase [Clostridia bacterium]
MVTFKLSAFADEYSPEFDKQIEGLKKNGIGMIEVRGVDGTGIDKITLETAKEIKAKLDNAGIGVSAIGSPIGKIDITSPIEPHLETLKHVIEIAKILGTKRIRMFSFFMPKEEKPEKYRDEVISRLSMMLDIAEENGMELCHENEKGIYGDTPERCKDILDHFAGRLHGVFDHANFLNVGAVPYPDGYEMLKKHIVYFHMKDAVGNEIYPVGKGNGRIPETIESIRRDFDGEIILTAEPHLSAFIGLDKLENTNEKIEKPFKDSEEAFGVAIDAIKAIIS